MKFKIQYEWLAVLATSTFAMLMHGANAAPTVNESVESVAKVNGIDIPKFLFDAVLATQLAQGAKDSEELRKLIKSELIAREVLAQEAKKKKLDKEPEIKSQLVFQEKNVLSEALLVKEVGAYKITDEQIKAEYKRQTELLADAEQFQISHVVLATEAEAWQVLKALKSGESFEKLAQTKSIDPSRQNGGNLGWLLSNQLIAPISNVVVNLSVGQVVAAPIQTQQGWQVVKLEGKRPFQAPAFADAKPQVVQAIQAAHRAEYIQGLLKTAKIQD